ncbi:MAG: hypothetical protein QG671_3312 [Actinomycetota bacterium]|nr:hypothetical protein [Actinomycetota bacterium]
MIQDDVTPAETIPAESTPADPTPAAAVPLPSQMRPRGPRPSTSTSDATGSTPGPPAPPSASEDFGRVDHDGNIFVTLPDGNEQFVGQWATGDPAEGLRLYARRYDDMVVDVDLAGHRLAERRMSPEEADRTVERVRAALLDPKCVGDLRALVDRVAQLELLIKIRREAMAEEKAAAKATAQARRAEIVEEAQKLATSTAWRPTGDRYKALVDEWKEIPRFDRAGEQEQWQTLRTARAEFDKARRAHFGEQDKAQSAAKAAKQRLIEKAEALADSTDWVATAREYRDLMAEWKQAGFAGKPADDKLWKRFRGAQDKFFEARKSALDSRDAGWKENLAKKRALVERAEKLLPVKDAKAARKELTAISAEFGGIGHVPRADKPKLDARLRKVDDAIRDREQDQWRRSDPERNARANQMVELYAKSVAAVEAELASARAAGRDTSALEADLAGKRELLDAARKYA